VAAPSPETGTPSLARLDIVWRIGAAAVSAGGEVDMAIVKHVGPGSAFKVGLVAYGVIGLILGIFCSLIALAGASLLPQARLPFHGALGLLAVVVCPIVYGLIGGIGAVIGALIYNLASSWVGGLEVDIS
jgi:hypothetical protein